MSWFTPKHFEDAQRILRGLALVAAKTAADSEVLKHATRGDVRRAAKAAADMARYQAQPVADAVGQATRDTAQSASNISDVLQGGAQNAEALFHQTQSGAQQVGSEPTSGRSKRSQSASFAGIPEPVYAESSYASPSTAAASPNSLQESMAPLQAAPSDDLQNPTSVAEDEVDTVIARTNPADRPPTEPSSATRGESNAASTPEASPSAVTADPTPPPSSAPIPSAAAPAYPTDSGSTLSEASQSVAAPLPPPATAPQSAHAEYRRLMQQRHRDRLNLHKDQINEQKEEVRKKLRERRVPSSAFGRAAGFAGMGASLVFGSMRDSVSNYFAPTEKAKQEGYNAYLTDKNAERLATALCRMRGAALKLGQMLSIQDEGVLPPQFQQALERVRAGADVMPQGQLHKVIQAELGVNWRNRMATFEDEPLAAASIGQVHGGKLHDGRRFAMKIQYPGVARSIESDVDNLMRLINIANLLPKGLYVEQAAEVAKRELSMECDYEYEARCQKRFKKLISSDPDLAESFNVPDIIDELSGKTVITSEWVPGVHIDKVKTMSQDIRNDVGSLLLRLTMRELFDWRFMQTDPNWGNFLYDEHADQLHLIDFGAAKEYPKPFVDDYLRMVLACADKNRDEVILRSTKLKFLTGDESKVMLDAHCDAGYLVGQPFATEGLYDFAMHSALSRKIAALGGVMLKHRLTAPPEEAYSLHRKLSGAFLACIKLGSQVPCRDILVDCAQGYKFD
ncbi:hypothetical protein WJX79_000563 [Trebouxia sp. C0005]